VSALLGGLRAPHLALGSFASASALGVGFIGAGGLVWACAKLMAATRLSIQNMVEEAALIRSREQTASAPV
jgi:hypothetical protein